MTYEEAVKILDSYYLDYIPSAASMLSALEDAWDEKPEVIDAVLVVVKHWEDNNSRELRGEQ